MSKEELITEIAKQPIALRLPLYAAAMQLGQLTYQEINQILKDTVVKPVTTVKKTAAKKTTNKVVAEKVTTSKVIPHDGLSN